MSWRNRCLLFAALAHITCNQAIMVAPPGSTLQIFANPLFIPANGGVSVISVLITEAAGTPVADGTVVQFFTTLGRIAEQGKTNDGVARVNLISDTRSGTAKVTAISGGPAAAASPGTGGGSSGVSVDVVIGSALPKLVIATADPTRIEPSDPREATIVANVFDANGNPVANVPIIFRIVPVQGSLPPDTERLESESAPRFTNNSGRAFDVLRTKYDPGAPQKTVGVLASTPIEGVEDTVTVTIN